MPVKMQNVQSFISVSLFFMVRSKSKREQRYINCSCYPGGSLTDSNGSRIINVSPGTLNALRLLLCSQIQLDVFKDLLRSERSAAFSCAPIEY